MSAVDIILIILIAAAFTFAVVLCVRNKKHGINSCGDCSKCSGCSYGDDSP